MERCPNCRARLSAGAETCRRCGMELHGLWAIEQAAEALLEQAVQSLSVGDFEQAEMLALQALELTSDSLAEALLGFIAEVEAEPTPVAAAPPSLLRACYYV